MAQHRTFPGTHIPIPDPLRAQANMVRRQADSLFVRNPATTPLPSYVTFNSFLSAVQALCDIALMEPADEKIILAGGPLDGQHRRVPDLKPGPSVHAMLIGHEDAPARYQRTRDTLEGRTVFQYVKEDQ